MPNRVQLAPHALISGLGDMLKLNPLLLSLFAVSPADALEHLGIRQSGWIEARRATSTADRAQVALLLDAINAGLTSLDPEPEILSIPNEPKRAPAAPAAFGQDPPAHTQSQAAPDITVIVARTTLQYALQRYAQQRFIGQIFQLAPQPWLNVAVTGMAIGLELRDGSARITARLDATFTGSLQIAGRRVTVLTRRSPIEIDLSAVFSVNRTGQLCVGVGPGSVCVPGLPLPAALIDALYVHMREMVAAVPIIYLPTRFDLPEAAEHLADEVQLQVSHIHVSAQAVTLEFQLFFSPSVCIYEHSLSQQHFPKP